MRNKTFTILAITIFMIFALSGCRKSKESQPATAPPKIEWASNPDFTTVEISEKMNIDIHITAEAGIRDFIVEVDSHAISPTLKLFTSDGTPNLDLINDIKLTAMLTAFGIEIPVGDMIKDQTEVNFSLSAFIPMIASVSGPKDHDTYHVFTINMTDNENRTLSKSLTFHYSYAE